MNKDQVAFSNLRAQGSVSDLSTEVTLISALTINTHPFLSLFLHLLLSVLLTLSLSLFHCLSLFLPFPISLSPSSCISLCLPFSLYPSFSFFFSPLSLSLIIILYQLQDIILYYLGPAQSSSNSLFTLSARRQGGGGVCAYSNHLISYTFITPSYFYSGNTSFYSVTIYRVRINESNKVLKVKFSAVMSSACGTFRV